MPRVKAGIGPAKGGTIDVNQACCDQPFAFLANIFDKVIGIYQKMHISDSVARKACCREGLCPLSSGLSASRCGAPGARIERAPGPKDLERRRAGRYRPGGCPQRPQ